MATTVPFCEDLELFKGEPNQNAVGWLRRFESERGTDITGKKISPTAWLCEFDSYIADEAATWADKTPAIREMLAEGHIHWATAEDVVKLKRMFRERFQPPETTGTGEAMQPLLNLKQGDTESLGAYYTRTLSLLLEAGGRDDPEVEGPHHRTDTVLPVAVPSHRPLLARGVRKDDREGQAPGGEVQGRGQDQGRKSEASRAGKPQRRSPIRRQEGVRPTYCTSRETDSRGNARLGHRGGRLQVADSCKGT